MKTCKRLFPLFLFTLFMLAATATQAQQPVTWTPDQLMDPALLAKKITGNEPLPYIFSIGPMALIPHSTDIGPDSEEENLASLKEAILKLPKDAEVVIYCGCCPFGRCPNIRPAIELFKTMNFKNFHLLNLPTSIKADWIDKGFPTVD